MKIGFFVKIVFRAFLVFSPIILASIIVFLNDQNNIVFEYLNRIDGNQFVINNILLVYIISGFLVILIGLVSYMLAVFDDTFKYCGKKIGVLRLNKIVVIILGLVLFLFILYNLYIVVSCSNWTEKGNNFFNIHMLVKFNRLISPFVFTLFLITDILILWSHYIQKKENQDLLKAGESKSIRANLGKNISSIRLSKDSIFFINIPSIILTSLTIFFIERISSMNIFRGIVDQSFDNLPFIPDVLPESFLELFANGLEAGIIVSVIIFSQIVFMVVKTRWELQSRADKVVKKKRKPKRKKKEVKDAGNNMVY